MITGRTRVIAVVGDPITAARAPQSLNDALAAAERDAVAVPVGVSADGLAAFVEACRAWQNLAGLVVTMPHKSAIAALVDTVTQSAHVTGAVNVVRRTPEGRLAGDQLDGSGFVSGLAGAGIPVAGKRLVLYGSGGVGRSIAFALAAAEPAGLVIVNRSRARASTLTDDLAAAFPQLDLRIGETGDTVDADLVVNATSVGSVVNPGMPFDPAELRPGTTVAEVVANPERTDLLTAAAAHGLRTHSGVRMQEAQFGRILDFLL